MSTHPYRRLFTEAFVIVASILLAFGIDAWWDERQEDEAAADLALGLREDVRLSLADLGDVREGNVRKRDASLLARELLRSPEPVVSMDSISHLLARSGGTSRLTPVLRSYEQLVSTGLLRRLDPEVRTALAAWTQQQEFTREYFERDLLDFRQNVGFPFWARTEVAFDQMLQAYPDVDVNFGEPRFPHSWTELHGSEELADVLAIFAVMTNSVITSYGEVEAAALALDSLLVDRYGDQGAGVD